jgi:hypothetical protein
MSMAGITRKQFSAALVGGTVLLWLGGCGGDPDEELEELDGNVRISSNHGHSLVIPAEDLDSVLAKTYDIRGTAGDHTHSVTVSPDQFRRIKEGQVVAVGTDTANNGIGADGKLIVVDGHTHTITANPAL